MDDEKRQKPEVQKIPIVSPGNVRPRPETGPMRFEVNGHQDGKPYWDWSGYFIRGDGTFTMPMAAEILEKAWEEKRKRDTEAGERFDFNEHIVVLGVLSLLKNMGDCHE